METIHTLAAHVSKLFAEGARKSEDTGRQIRVLPHEGEPGFEQWIQDLCYAAHTDDDGSNMLPDDFRYEMIEEAIDIIAAADSESVADERAEEAEPPIYNAELTAWLASHLFRPSYCDDAEEEYGSHEGGTIGSISRGYRYEFMQVYRSVLASLKEHLETLETEATA